MIPEFNGDFIQWLRGFYHTAQAGSMSAATSAMNRNQPTLTYQIKALEQALGVPLFSREKGRRELTREGQYLLAKTINIFETINGVMEDIGDLPEELNGEISIAAFYTLMEHYLPERVTRFCQRYPEVRFRLSGGSEQESLFTQIYTRNYDFGLLCIDSVPADFHTELLFASDIVLITPKTGPYAVAELPALEEITRHPFISHPDKSSLEPFLHRQFARHGLALRSRHMVSLCDSVKQYVALGLGISVLDGFVCTEEDRARLNVVSLSAYFPQRRFGIVRRREQFVPPHLEAFLRYLRAAE